MRFLKQASIITGLCIAASAGAQTPTPEQIIRSLRPTGPLSPMTRGIKPVGPAEAPAAPTQAPRPASQAMAAPMAAPPPAPAAAPSVNLTVEFATGSAELTPPARSTLDALGRALASPQLAGYRFRIEGHTDTVGSPDLNKTLSEQRAAAVAAYLTSQFAVAAARLEPVGMGQEGLLVPTPANTAEPRNRRVQVVNVGS